MNIGKETIAEIQNQVKTLLFDNKTELKTTGEDSEEGKPVVLSIRVALSEGKAAGTTFVETKLSFVPMKITDSQEGTAFEDQMPMPFKVEVAK